MLKALIKKQFDECFRSYFVNQKTGKANSGKKIAGLFVFFAVLMLFMCSLGFLLGYGMDGALYKMYAESSMDIRWLQYAALGVAAILMGVFGSVFNTYASLYLPKDNEQLLAMPIKPGMILTSRLTMVYLLSLLYSGIIWLPGVLAAAVNGHATAPMLIIGVLLTFVIALFVTVLTCALGWVIAIIAGRIRNKGIVSAMLGIGFFIIYYVVCFNMSSLMEQLQDPATLLGLAGGVKTWGGPLYTLGMAAMGDVTEALLVTAVVAAVALVCYLIMSKSYMSMLLRKPKAPKAKVKMEKSVQRSVRKALFIRDLQRFTASATYMMNSGMGAVLVPVLTVVMIFYQPRLNEMVTAIKATGVWPQITQCLPMLVPIMLSFLLGMDMVSLPSISLEGKNLWILQTLPVGGWPALRSKRDLHLVMGIVPGLVCGLVLCLLLKTGILWIAATALFVVAFNWFFADLGLVIGLKHANLKWTNETTAIKQNIWVLVLMVVNMIITAGLGAATYFLCGWLQPVVILLIVTAIQALLTVLMEKWLRGKGAAMFETL